jgi:NADH dehydrogenase (ubiquinone) Fe-S protein 6
MDPFVPETTYVTQPRVACDGSAGQNPALGHPRVYLQIDEKGFVDCGYCDRRFILKGGPADVPGQQPDQTGGAQAV